MNLAVEVIFVRLVNPGKSTRFKDTIGNRVTIIGKGENLHQEMDEVVSLLSNLKVPINPVTVLDVSALDGASEEEDVCKLNVLVTAVKIKDEHEQVRVLYREKTNEGSSLVKVHN